MSDLNLIADAIRDYLGERCSDFDPGCLCCRAWAEYDEITALDGQPMLSGWRLIETAPTDGTWVLCFGTLEDEGGDYDKERKIFTAQFTNFCNGARREKGWWQFAWFDGGFYGRCKPTHWMPLPPAPGKEEA